MIPCPLCGKTDQMIYSDGGYIDDAEYYPMTCDLDELYCKSCNTTFPLCSTCNGYKYEFPIDTTDLQILHFIGCIGVQYSTPNNVILIHPNGDVAEDDYFEGEKIPDPNNNEPIPDEFKSKSIGQYISYFVFPQPGFNEDRIHSNICVTGPDGGYPTYWWCPKCKNVSEQTDK